jgi:hypothetical protein
MRRRAEEALHDDARGVLIDLEDHGAGERLVGVELLPQLTLCDEGAGELVDRFDPLSFFDRARRPDASEAVRVSPKG